MTESARCFRCGADRSADDPVTALAWAAEHSERGPRWLCPACARIHARDIEGTLPAEWW